MKNDREENRRLSEWVKAELDSRGLSHLFNGPKKQGALFRAWDREHMADLMKLSPSHLHNKVQQEKPPPKI
jgi:hypothetical protein